MTFRRTASTAAVALAAACGALAAAPAIAATPQCGPGCISIFSREFGSYGNPGFVETVLGGQARIGQPVVVQRASGMDPSQDLKPRAPGAGLVHDFYEAGMVSAAVDRRYGDQRAAQIAYAPLGVTTELCVGVRSVPKQNEGLTLQPCSAPGRTVWIVAANESPATAPQGYFPLVNGATKNLSRPYAMDYPRGAHPASDPTQPIIVRHLKKTGRERTVDPLQLWGLHFGPLGG